MLNESEVTLLQTVRMVDVRCCMVHCQLLHSHSTAVNGAKTMEKFQAQSTCVMATTSTGILNDFNYV